jgi:HSP20 family protein
MQLVRWNPMRGMFRWGRPMDRLFEDFFAPSTTDSAAAGLWSWEPKVDIAEKDGSIEITADLPGVDKKDLVLDLDGRVLTIKGERSSENEVKEENFYRRERTYGGFQRIFTLPTGVDPDAITANYKDGVLKVSIPKPAGQETKKIAVN